MTVKIIQLTDLHLVSDGTLYGADPAARLEEAVAAVNARHADADLVVVTGDVTHWAEPAAYAQAAEILGGLTPPMAILPGNHDLRAPFLTAFPGAAEGDFIQSVREISDLRMVFLDTVDEGAHAGAYCAARRDWLAERLGESDRDVMLFLHHPPFPVSIPRMDDIQMRQEDAEALHTVLAAHAPRIRHLAFGHIHRAISGSWRGIPYSCMRATSHQVGLDLERADHGMSGDFAPAAYGVLLADQDQVTVHMETVRPCPGPFQYFAPEGEDARAYAQSDRFGDNT